MLVKAHEDGVAAGFRARLEVEDHDFPSPRARGEKGEPNWGTVGERGAGGGEIKGDGNRGRAVWWTAQWKKTDPGERAAKEFRGTPEEIDTSAQLILNIKKHTFPITLCYALL